MRVHKLGHQLMLSMSSVAATATAIVFVGSFLFYGIYLSYFPMPPGPLPLFPRAPDFILIAFLLLVGLVVAIIFALRLAKRILAPLTSLAEGARRIAAGDLTARALPGDRSLGETAQLVDDFNNMAQQLENAEKAVLSWNAAVAHELRTPLTILRGRLQGLSEGVFPPSEDLFRNLLSQIESLTRLVEDLRIVTLFDSRQLDVRLASTDLAEVARSTVDSMRPSLSEAGFEVELIAESAVLNCDGIRLRQALLALLENARRHATPGPLRVKVRKTSDMTIISVEDRGPGLPPAFVPCAFETFTRVEPSRSRQFGGSGLGLAVVRAVVEAHGGKVRYRPSRYGGSVFELIFQRSENMSPGPSL